MPKEKLRNFGKFLGVYLLTAVGAMVLLMSCNWPHHSDNYDVANDSVMIAQAIKDASNPQFTSIGDIVEYRTNHADNKAIDSVFFSLSQATVQNVASVLLKRDSKGITKRDIVEEYKRCRNVYDNLPTSNTPDSTKAKESSVDRTATDLGQRPSKTTINFRTDTVDGKPVKVMVKTEETYE